jgi:FkbM family methyltransferase
MKHLLKKMLSRYGLEVRRVSKDASISGRLAVIDHAAVVNRMLASNDPLIVFDAGAHTGEMTSYYLSSFATGIIHAFEPLPDLYASLQRRFASNPRVKLCKTALSDNIGVQRFTRTKFSPASSLLTPNEHANNYWGDSVFDTAEEIEVQTMTLDSYVEEHSIKKINLLKLDVQGAEKKVLSGGSKTFLANRVDAVYIELTNITTYHGQPRIAELLTCLEDRRFELHSIHNVDCGKNGFIRQFDALFFCSTVRTMLDAKP